MSNALIPAFIKTVPQAAKASFSGSPVLAKAEVGGKALMRGDFKKSLEGLGKKHSDAPGPSGPGDAGSAQAEGAFGERGGAAPAPGKIKPVSSHDNTSGKAGIKGKDRGRHRDKSGKRRILAPGREDGVFLQSPLNIAPKGTSARQSPYEKTSAAPKPFAASSGHGGLYFTWSASSEGSIEGARSNRTVLGHKKGKKGTGKGGLVHKGVKDKISGESVKGPLKKASLKVFVRADGVKAAKAAPGKVRDGLAAEASAAAALKEAPSDPMINTLTAEGGKLKGASAKVSSHSASKHISTKGAVNALKKAVSKRRAKAGLLREQGTARGGKRARTMEDKRAAIEKKELSEDGFLKSAYGQVSEGGKGGAGTKLAGLMSLNPSPAANAIGGGDLGAGAEGGAAGVREPSEGPVMNSTSGAGVMEGRGRARTKAANLHGGLRGAHGVELIKRAAGGVVMSLNERDKEIVIELRPKELGEMKIKVRLEDGFVETSILVDNPRVMAMLKADAALLKELLAEEGIVAGGLEVALNNGGNDFGFNGEFRGEGEGPYKARNSANTEPSGRSGARELLPGLGKKTAARGGLDLFI